VGAGICPGEIKKTTKRHGTIERKTSSERKSQSKNTYKEEFQTGGWIGRGEARTFQGAEVRPRHKGDTRSAEPSPKKKRPTSNISHKRVGKAEGDMLHV